MVGMRSSSSTGAVLTTSGGASAFRVLIALVVLLAACSSDGSSGSGADTSAASTATVAEFDCPTGLELIDPTIVAELRGWPEVMVPGEIYTASLYQQSDTRLHTEGGTKFGVDRVSVDGSGERAFVVGAVDTAEPYVTDNPDGNDGAYDTTELRITTPLDVEPGCYRATVSLVSGAGDFRAYHYFEIR